MQKLIQIDWKTKGLKKILKKNAKKFFNINIIVIFAYKFNNSNNKVGNNMENLPILKDLRVLKKELINGTDYKFENNGIDGDLVEIYYTKNDRNSWADGYKIRFNGELTYSYKEFLPFIAKLHYYIKKYNLKQLHNDN